MPSDKSVKFHHKCFICGKTPNRLFRFPSDPQTVHGRERLKKWEEFIGPKKELLQKKKINYICSIHFADKDFQTPSRKKLNNYSVPSLHPPEGKGGCSDSTSSSSVSLRKESSRKSPDPPDTLATNTSLDLRKGGCSDSTSSSSVSLRKESSRKSPDPPDTLATNTSLDLSLIEDEKKRKFIESILAKGPKRILMKRSKCQDKNDKERTKSSSKDIENTPIGNNSRSKVSIATQTEISSSEPRLLRVVGQENRQNYSVINRAVNNHSTLDKMKNLKKINPVYVVPLKKHYGTQLTKDKLKRIIENLPTVSKSIKVRILSAIKDKPSSVGKQNYPKNKRQERKMPTKQCTCTLHCNKYIRRKPIIKVSPSVGVKLEGVPLASDMQLEFSDDNTSSFENLFTVSTILTNVNDKSQLQQLCQLLIESLFRLKNVNTDGTMTKLVVYLSQGCLLKSYGINEESRNVNFVGGENTCQGPTGNLRESDSGPVSGDNSTNSDSVSILNPICKKMTNCNQTSCQQPKELPLKVDGGPMTSTQGKHVNITQNYSTAKKTSEVEGKTKHVRINLNVFHDHNYLSHETQVLFEKPPYFVNLINIDKFKSSKKKTRITRCFPKKLPRKYQQDILRLHGQVIRLKRVLKKKDNNILKMNSKIKYLATVLCKEKGLKKIRYPKIKQKSENQLHDGEEVQKAIKNITPSEDQGYVKVKTMKDRNIDKANTFVTSLSENNRLLPTVDIQRDSLESGTQETSHRNFDDSFQHFCDPFIDDHFERDVGL